MAVADEVAELLGTAGKAAYFGESVSQEDHALQCAHLAERAGADDVLVVAALLHDVGHLLHQEGENVADQGIDACHETVGCRWLMQEFGPDVAEPVRLHVAAKRFLCATSEHYRHQLSNASLVSLRLQGGPMSASECESFASTPYCSEAVRIRKWDDEAKVPGLRVPNLEHYRPRIDRLSETWRIARERSQAQ